MAEVRYRALRIGWIRAAVGVLVVPVCLLMLGLGVLLLTADSAAGFLLALVCLSAALFLIAVWLLGTRLQFLVDDEGVTLVHYVRTHRIPWEQVAVIEQSHTYWTFGAAVVVLREPVGRRLTALATTDRTMIYRGENPFAHVDTRTAYAPRRPTRAAVDAHRRWLAGRHEAPGVPSGTRRVVGEAE